MITKLNIIVFLTFIVMNFDNKIQAQSVFEYPLPPLDSLLNILHESDSQILNAELTEFQHSYRWSWWYLVPSFGYDLVNYRPMLVFNTSSIITHFTQKRRMERRIFSIEKSHNWKAQNNQVKLATEYNSLKNSIIQLDMLLETYSHIYQLFDITQAQYTSNEINTESFIKEQITFNEKKKEVYSQIDQVNEYMLSIELLINRDVFNPVNYSVVRNYFKK